jgi:hypothetical protein
MEVDDGVNVDTDVVPCHGRLLGDIELPYAEVDPGNPIDERDDGKYPRTFHSRQSPQSEDDRTFILARYLD